MTLGICDEEKGLSNDFTDDRGSSKIIAKFEVLK